jgi:hypothetical protein
MNGVKKSGKLNFYLFLVLRITLVLAIPLSLWERNWIFVFLSSVTFLLTFIPSFIEKRYKINIPSEIEIVVVLFIYAGIFLGDMRGFYNDFWWWDSLLHLIGGIGLGFLGFLILYYFYKTGKFQASPKVIVLFAFCFALSIGALWEIFEFLVDIFFGSNMQKAKGLEVIYGYCNTSLGVLDTMLDLILDAIGALIASLAGYFYLKNGESFLFGSLVKKFERENKKLFRN